MPNSLNNALNNIDLSSLGMSMNGAPSGGQRLNFNINTLINPNPSIPIGAMTASQHTITTKSGKVRNAAKGEITAQANGQNIQDIPTVKGFINSKVGKFGSSYGGVIGDTASALGDMIGKRGLDGKHGGITKGMDTAYDTIQKAAANLGPYGQIVSAAMGVNKLIGNAVSKIGGGTDGMTKTDAVLNSAFLNMTPLGLINGFGGKKANTYTRNAELDKSTNGGFQGFLTTQDVTQIGAGKKYGLFSSGARNKQNQLTEFTSNMKHTISGIVDTNTINNLAAQGSTPFIANQQSVDLSGGVQQMRAARQGMQFSRRVISKYQIGNKLKRTIKVLDTATNQYVEIPLNLTKDQIKGREPIKLLDRVVYMAGDGTVSSDHWESGERKQHLTPKGQEGIRLTYREWYNGLKKKGVTAPNYDYKLAFESLPYEELIAHYNNPKKNHLHSVAPLPNGDYIFLKLGKTGEVEKELEMYNSGKTGIENTHRLSYEGDRYYYRRKPNFKAGEFSQNGQIVSLHKQGGQMNVIPEGALHARLNHLDQINDDLTHVTTKGIPVITKEGGEVVQHAEIEHSEIIFTLDVTNKIEDLRKKWHEDKEDKYAIEAGKLLVKEILHNTDDRTNLIESVE